MRLSFFSKEMFPGIKEAKVPKLKSFEFNWIMKIFPDNYKQIRLGFKKIEGRAPLNFEPGKTFSEMKCGDLITFKAVSREDKKSLRRRGLLKFYLIIVIMNEHRRNQLIKC